MNYLVSELELVLEVGDLLTMDASAVSVDKLLLTVLCWRKVSRGDQFQNPLPDDLWFRESLLVPLFSTMFRVVGLFLSFMLPSVAMSMRTVAVRLLAGGSNCCHTASSLMTFIIGSALKISKKNVNQPAPTRHMTVSDCATSIDCKSTKIGLN
jgi:hypothetical protein